ncbi:MAG: helix-turn-helix domain-containing protein [Acidobacteriota bacterium]
MTSHDSQLSLTDLGSSGIAVHHAEAVTIVRELMRRASDGELPGVPSAQVIRLHASGEISVEGPIATDDRAVVRAATLLQALLPGFDAPAELRVPGALRLVIARALGTVDLPPYASLQDFAGALERFASTELPRVVRDLVVRHAETAPQAPEPVQREADAVVPDERDGSARAESESEAVEPAPLQRLEPRDTELTISDIRRARRATGLTLEQISERSHISPRLLVELEWGYMRNWPASPVGRTQLVRYARAAGLDDRIVVRTVWPMLEEAARARPVLAPDVPEVALVPFVDALPRPLPAVSSTSIPDPPARPAGRRRYLAALAIPALLAIGIVPALWERSMRAHQRDATHQTAPAPDTSSAAAPAAATRGVVPPQERPRPQPPAPAAASAGAAAAMANPASRPENRGRTDVASAAGPAPAASPVRGLSAGPAYSPSFASVGTAMFYQAESGDRSALMRADTDSRGAILRITSIVDDRAHNFHARPSPDGDRIAFDSDRDGERGVYVADADGTNVRRISGDGFAAIPSWSPDGKTIAFVRGEDGHPKVWNLWTTDIESGQTRRLTSYRVGAPWGGSWFPDGRRLAYSHETELVVLDLESGKRRVFRSPVAGRLVRTPAVSPDGRRVMFQVSRDGAWLLDLPEGSMRKVLSDPSAEEYTWAPDGRRVAYHSRGTGTWGVWVMAPR